MERETPPGISHRFDGRKFYTLGPAGRLSLVEDGIESDLQLCNCARDGGSGVELRAIHSTMHDGSQ